MQMKKALVIESPFRLVLLCQREYHFCLPYVDLCQGTTRRFRGGLVDGWRKKEEATGNPWPLEKKVRCSRPPGNWDFPYFSARSTRRNCGPGSRSRSRSSADSSNKPGRASSSSRTPGGTGGVPADRDTPRGRVRRADVRAASTSSGSGGHPGGPSTDGSPGVPTDSDSGRGKGLGPWQWRSTESARPASEPPQPPSTEIAAWKPPFVSKIALVRPIREGS